MQPISDKRVGKAIRACAKVGEGKLLNQFARRIDGDDGGPVLFDRPAIDDIKAEIEMRWHLWRKMFACVRVLPND